jgi:hypothetical protein
LHARQAEEAAIKEAAQRAEAAAARELDEAAELRRGEHLHARQAEEAAVLRRQVQAREEAEAARTARAAAAAAAKAEAAAAAATRAAEAREALELQAQMHEERRQQHASAHHGADERRQHARLHGKGSHGPSTLPSAGPSTMAFDWSAVAPAPSAAAAPGGAGKGRGARGGALGGSHSGRSDGGRGAGRGGGRGSVVATGAVGMTISDEGRRRGEHLHAGAAGTTISDEELARSLHQEEVQRITSHRAAVPPAAATTSATPVVNERAQAGPARPSRRTIVVVIDGMNVGRNRSTVDPEFEDLTNPKRLAFDEVRARAGERSPPLLALGVIAAIAAVLKANDSKEARAASVEYLPMAFLVEWVRDGGRTGALKAFNAERLDAWQVR